MPLLSGTYFVSILLVRQFDVFCERRSITMELNIMDCVLPVTWAVSIATIIWLFRKGNVENAAQVGAAAEESRLLPTADQAFNLMKCRAAIL